MCMFIPMFVCMCVSLHAIYQYLFIVHPICNQEHMIKSIFKNSVCNKPEQVFLVIVPK